MTTLFAQSVKPPTARVPFAQDERGAPVVLSLEALSMLQQMWSWVAAGYVVIPCDVGGSADAIELTPKFRPEIGGSGYAHLLPFSFVPLYTSAGGGTTIQVIGEGGVALDALPAYVGASAAGAGDFVAGVPCVTLYCEAMASVLLPDRMVRT
ncbi:MAG: hypothetical protein Q7R41_16610 [Phycisphaerales bacterium]|nr:hypothetical protein [Phycisphaerales bacterium]